MSLRDQINTCCGDGRLISLPPLIRSDPVVRHLFVAEEVFKIVRGPWPKSTEGVRHASLRALLDRFTAGGRITVADHPTKKKNSANMARVRPPEDEIFDFRAMDPEPGIRAFGSFAEKDTFVVVTWRYREELEYDPVKWGKEILRCKAKWRLLFHAYPPPPGSLDDHISNFEPV